MTFRTPDGETVTVDILERAMLEIPGLMEEEEEETLEQRRDDTLNNMNGDKQGRRPQNHGGQTGSGSSETGLLIEDVDRRELETPHHRHQQPQTTPSVSEGGSTGNNNNSANNDGDDEASFGCGRCGRRYKFESFLKVHQRRPCS